MFKFGNVCVRTAKNNIALSNIIRLSFSSLTSTAEAKNVLDSPQDNETKKTATSIAKNDKKPFANQTIVAAAFASLQHENADLSNGIQTPFTDNKITQAQTVEEILSLSEGSGISRRHAFKVVSTLATWANTGKVKMADFETDPRFLKLCRVLAKGMTPKQNNKLELKSEDLSTILTVTADDEAAKLVASITLPQMVKVMSTLSLKKRRSTMLLRALAYNITKNGEKLDLKQCADLLYSMAVLNFPDANLLERVKNDICTSIETANRRSAVVGSILTSIGLLKYRDADLLEVLTTWILQNHDICRSQDLVSYFLTLAMLNYQPQNMEKLFGIVQPQLTMVEIGKATLWLEYIWSLVLLKKATAEQVASVLSESFISTIKDDSQGLSTVLKLLNIDAAAQHFIKGYNGPRITSELKEVNIVRSKDKEDMVKLVFESLKNLMPAETHLKKKVSTQMGFYIDASCVIDKKCKPIALNKATNEHIKVAIMVQDYHDLCKGDTEPTGVNVFAYSLLEKAGYKILTIPYTEFKPQEKLVQRVKYVEAKLKSLV